MPTRRSVVAEHKADPVLAVDFAAVPTARYQPNTDGCVSPLSCLEGTWHIKRKTGREQGISIDRKQ